MFETIRAGFDICSFVHAHKALVGLAIATFDSEQCILEGLMNSVNERPSHFGY
jgi:hypothetical protein